MNWHGILLLLIALLTPGTTIKERYAVCAARMNACSALAGRMLRSMPIIAPANTLAFTRSVNRAGLGRSPSTGFLLL